MKTALLIVPAADRAAANASVANSFPNAGPETCSVPLSPDGSAPATHYGGSWRGLNDAQFSALAGGFSQHPTAWFADADVTPWDAFLAAHSLRPVSTGG
jgi:hypothetical protein